MPQIPLNDDDLRALLEDITNAEKLSLPGPAKQTWVIACQLQRHTQSLPPTWAWLLVKLLDVLIPILIEWLKHKYGDNWITKTKDTLELDRLPWQDSSAPRP